MPLADCSSCRLLVPTISYSGRACPLVRPSGALAICPRHENSVIHLRPLYFDHIGLVGCVVVIVVVVDVVVIVVVNIVVVVRFFCVANNACTAYSPALMWLQRPTLRPARGRECPRCAPRVPMGDWSTEGWGDMQELTSSDAGTSPAALIDPLMTMLLV